MFGLGKKTDENEVEDSALPHEKKVESKEIPPLTIREMKALKRSRYEDIKDKYDTAFVLRNKKTGQIAEIRAISSYQACKIIGWKSNEVRVIEKKQVGPIDLQEVSGEAETTTLKKVTDNEECPGLS